MTTHEEAENIIHPVVVVFKRLFDIFSSLTGLLCFLLVLPLLAILIKLDSKGPIFYKQLRIGQAYKNYTRLIYIYKLRTMHLHQSDHRSHWTSNNDPRVTRLGKILRKCRIDEFPQLFNVLMGDMSLIGPRPVQPGMLNQLEQAIPFYSERIYHVKPGLTGYAQVYNARDHLVDTNDAKIQYERDKLAYDHAYALILTNPLQWLRTDLTILFQTCLIVLTYRGN